MPNFIEHQRGTSVATPQIHYRWKDTEAALNQLCEYAGSPYDGIILEYKNPVNGEDLALHRLLP